jgi:DNA-directed RNA polymerase subunit RPC12/RpoP
MGSVTSLEQARINKELTTKVHDCGKCGEQGAELCANGHIMCGGKDCDARWALNWYEPTDPKTKAKYARPRLRKDLNIYGCSHCMFPFFHIQSDGSITCYRETCKRKTLFRWRWLDNVRSA